MDEKPVCRMLGLPAAGPRGKVVTAIMRDVLLRLDDLRKAETAALFSVTARSVTLESLSPRPALLSNESDL